MNLGVSVYPDIRPLPEIKEYLKLASQYGCTRVFSSMFSVEGTKEEVLNYFRELIEEAHKWNMEVSLDVNPSCFEKLNASADDLCVFNDIHVDILRMDLSYGIEEDMKLLLNPYNIKIEFNASMMKPEVIKEMLKRGAKPENLLVCHNFYPQRYTGLKWEKFRQMNHEFAQLKVRTGAFISSHAENTHGVWDAVCGLPTVEKLRDLPIDLQMRIMMATEDVSDVLIGSAYASEDEFQLLQKALEIKTMQNDHPIVKMLMNSGKDLVQKKIRVQTDENISDVEKEILFDFFPHTDVGDSSEWIWRSRMPRFKYSKIGVEPRPYEKDYFEVGDVVIVNNNYRHYAGEVQIVIQPIINDGTRNLVGHINEQEFEMMELIHDKDIVVFME